MNALKRYFGAFQSRACEAHTFPNTVINGLAQGLAGATIVKELNSLSHLLDVAAKDWGIPLATNPAKMVRRPAVAAGRDRRLLAGEESRLFAACTAAAPRCSRRLCGSPSKPGCVWAKSSASSGATWTCKPASPRCRIRRPESPDRCHSARPQWPPYLPCRAISRWSGILDVARADSLENAWRRAVNAAGIEDLRFHDLRHEAVSRLFEIGLNPMEVASISGHKTLQMLKRYTHLKASELVKKLA